MPELRRGRWAWHFDAGHLYLAVCRGRLTRFVEVRVGWRGRVWTSALGGGWPEVVGWSLAVIICLAIPMIMGYHGLALAGGLCLALAWWVLSPTRKWRQ